MVATWPERGQQAPDYWDGQLKAYVDEMQTLPSRLGDLGLPASGTELSASFEAKVDRTGATAGQVPTLQADGTMSFEDGGAVSSVNSKTGAVVLTASDVGAATPSDVSTASTADRARANHTGTQSLDTTTDSATRVAMTPAERAKLGGVATNATANATDAQLRDRSTHTGTQAASTITGLATVATSGAYGDLSGKPTLGDAAAKNTGTGSGDVATGDHTHLLAAGATDVTATATELNYVDGVTSPIQDQINGKVPTSRTVSAGTGLTGGGDLSANRSLAVSYGTSAGTAAQGNDARLVDNAKSVGGGREKVAALSATTGTATGDLSAASIFTVTPTGNITLAFSNVPATGTSCTVTVVVTQGGTVRTVTMPSGAYPVGAAYPTQVANKRCWLTLVTIDGGTSWAVSGAVEQ